jgi:competence protein ComGC
MSSTTDKKKGFTMEILIPLAVLGVLIVLKVWVLPWFGMKT